MFHKTTGKLSNFHWLSHHGVWAILSPIWLVRSRALFPDKKKVPYASKWLGRENAYDAARNADGPAKSLQVKINAMTDFFSAKFCFLQIEWKWAFWQWILLSWWTVQCRTTSVANLLRKYRGRVNTPHKWTTKLVICLPNEWGRAGRVNIWPSVRTHGPRCARSLRIDLPLGQ